MPPRSNSSFADHSWKCSNAFWQIDDFDQCHRQKYLEYLPLVVALIGVLLYNIYTFYAPPTNDTNNDIAYGPDLVKPSNAPDKDARIIIRGRSPSDRLRLILEMVLNGGLVCFHLKYALDKHVQSNYAEYAPWLPVVMLLVAVYTFGLSIYRFLNFSTMKHVKYSPFKQLAYLYSLQCVVLFLEWFSQYNHPFHHSAYKMISLAFAAVLGNWWILVTSPVGDDPLRLYTSKGSVPSTEPGASLLRIMTCCWNSQMILKTLKKPLEATDVWDLTENNHVYKFMERSKRCPQSYSFVRRLIYVNRSRLILNIVFGCSGALLKLVPTVFIQKILQFLEEKSVPVNIAWLYVFALGFSYLVSNITSNQAYFQGRRLSIGIRALIIGSVYHKALYSRVSKSCSKDSDCESDAASATGSGTSSATGSADDSENLHDFDTSSPGAVINLMSVDSFKVSETAAYLHDLIATPLLVLLSVGFLYQVIGWSAFVALLCLVLMGPLNVYLAKKLNAVQDSLMAVTDKRVEKTNELLGAVRIIKYYAWERKFTEGVMEVREKELNLLLWRYIFWMFNGFFFFLVPIMVVVSSFWCYVRFQGGTLTSSIAFTAMSVFNIMRMPINELAFMFTDVSSTIVSLRRINKYLADENTPKYEQLKQPKVVQTRNGPKEFIGFENASFNWGQNNNGTAGSDDAFGLRNINFGIAVGDLNVIVGPTGSGKTSLLLALLGEMPLVSGNVYLPHGNRRAATVDPNTGLADTVAYCSQEAWLVNDTIKNNIIFAHDFDRKRYNAVIKACELKRDLEILEKGDQTLIGDKGISLSGGQKQRVSLARALYSNSRHLILDDCLSAVDSHTAEALYNTALTGTLALHRTIILVSHNVALTIGKAAMVVVLSNGRVLSQGTPAEVAASGYLGNDQLISRSAEQAELSRTNSSAELQNLGAAAANGANGTNGTNGAAGAAANLTDDFVPEVPDEKHDEEERAVGSVPFYTYAKFISQLGTRKSLFLLLIMALLVPVMEYMESWWVKVWTQHMGNAELTVYNAFVFIVNPKAIANSIHFQNYNVKGQIDDETLRNLRFYSLMYVVIGVGTVTAALTREFIIYYGGLRASRRIFEQLLTTVVRAKTRFFDATPSGRIMNRFSKDMEVIDQEICANLLWLLICIVDSLQVALIISWITPWLIPIAIVVIYLFTLIARAYLASARELKRLESVTRSPIFQQFGETLSGSVVIRAYDDTQRFVNQNWMLVDDTHRPYFWLWVSNRWLSFWCSMLSLIISVSASSLIVAASKFINPGMAGISLSFSTYFGDCILWVVRMYAQCEVSMNSVERVEEFLDIEQEAPAIIPENRPPASWPSRGEIKFDNLSLRYADNLPLVIKDVTFHVEGGQKVGVVGRTGAGKSTIITALFRMLEPVNGTIFVDGVDITTIGLEDLRKKISIIPQDPTLFKGSLRFNLDLFNEYSDEKIFEALASVQLVPPGTTSSQAAQAAQSDVISEVTGDATDTASTDSSENTNQFLNLEFEISESGRNLSQGQRQLICLARAILKEPKILLLDEATASIDYDTDATIQRTIRKSFANTTILTIAHRLRTIADYDKILVLEKGEVAQFAHPHDLLNNKSGIFFSMCEKSGELDTLIEIAKQAKHSA